MAMQGVKTIRLDSHKGVDYHLPYAEVAQVVEHGTENAGVASSTLALGTSANVYDTTQSRSTGYGLAHT